MDKRILLPTDFSKNALNAVRYALKLYADQKCTFYFLNVYEVDGFFIDGSAYRPEPGERSYEIEQRKSEEAFEKLAKKLLLKTDNPNHSYETVSTYSTLLDATKDIIAKRDIDIVIMGTRGMTESRSIIFGTNALTIMEGITECPVLTIPENLEFTPPKEIVFPTDYKSTFKRRNLKYMIDIAQIHGGFIRILHVKKMDKLSKLQKDNKDLLASIFTAVDHSFHELEDIAVRTGINTFIDSRDSDMVAFINHKHNFFRKIVSKPLVKELGYHSKIPVLVLRNRN